MHAAIVTAAILAVSPRWGFEDAYDNVAGGDWYIGEDNEDAVLAWGESYVMMSLAAMARATGHPRYLDRLARHIDGVLAQRDDARGVADYRGVSGACWRNTGYQDQGEAYCYAVHSGMLISPMAEFARIVAGSPYKDVAAYDGVSFADKAAVYVAAAQATVAYHDDEWNPAGYYVFRADATFLQFAGQDQPLNQSNALGAALLSLHDVTGEPAYLDKATALAQRLRSLMTLEGGALLWNYYGGPYAAPGEDISHAAINVAFAAEAAARGVVFTGADVDALATTFLSRVYVDDATFSDFVGGGSVNGDSYRAQIGRWLPVSRARAAVYTAVHDAFVRDYPPGSIGSGSVLLGWAYLAEFEPRVCPHFFYPHDWQDGGDHLQATAYGANVLTTPPDLTRPCRVPLTVQVPRPTVAAQWDGAVMHRGASWRSTGEFVARSVPYEPRWPHVYYEGGVLFEFQDEFVPGQGIRVEKPAVFTPPAITSQPETEGAVAVPWTYAPTGAGDPPFWWSLRAGPPGLAVDPATGVVAFTPDAPGDVAFSLVLENDLGEAVQDFVVHVPSPAETTGSTTMHEPTSGAPDPTDSTGSTSSLTGDAGGTGGTGGGAATTGAAAAAGDDGCGCRGGAGGLPALLLLLGRRRRRAASALACALALAPACGPKDGETNATTADPTTSESTSTTTGPTTGATQDTTSSTTTTMTTTTAGTSEGSSTGEPPPPVECDGVTCAGGQLCLWPPSVCDYNEMPPEVKRGGKMCAAFPPACEGMTDGLAQCLSEALCDGSVLHEASSYEMGLLDCFPAWNDCF